MTSSGNDALRYSDGLELKDGFMSPSSARVMVIVGIDRRLRGRAGGINGDNLLRGFLPSITAEKIAEKML